MFIKMQVFNEQTYKYNKKYILFMKFIKQFATDELMNTAISQIKHKDGAFLFGVSTINGIKNIGFCDQQHPGPNCLKLNPVNMTPVKLDTSSSKKKPAVADVLYSTAAGKLTLDTQTNGVNNTAIAICVIPEVIENFSEGDDSMGAVKTARFVSINYMNYKIPAIGKTVNQSIYLGNYGVDIGNVKGGTDETAYIGGKWNTQQCLSKATNQDKNICDGVTNSWNAGYCAPACCCVAYSTLGTKPGDWYLPMPDELHQIYVNKTAINKKRTTLVGKGFLDYGYYWSSREEPTSIMLNDDKKITYNEQYIVAVDNGIIFSSDKSQSYTVLAFLALEY